MTDELDLETGDPSRAEKILAAGKEAGPRSARATRSKSSTSKSTSKASTEAEDRSLRGDLVSMFTDFAEHFAHDPELVDILDRRKEAMSTGLVGVTRKLPFFRAPVKVLVALFQPTVAFWELGGYTVRKLVERRQAAAYEQRAEANGEVTPTTDAAHGYAT